MKKLISSILQPRPAVALTAVLAVFVAGCSDPSTQVHRAAASEAQEGAGPQSGKEYAIGEGSTISFIGSKVTGSHDGGFKDFSGTLRVADGEVIGTSEIRIDMNSTWSDDDRLTAHLKSPDFFDVEKHPYSTFIVTGIERSGNERLVTGNLTLHGITKSISFPAMISVSDEIVELKAEFAINRKDFDINYPGRPNDLIRDNVVIKLGIVATFEGSAEDALALR